MENIEDLLNNYAKSSDKQELLEKAENLAKALVITKDNYGIIPTASSYVSFEKKDGAQISTQNTKKDVVDVARQIDKNKLDTIKDKRLSLKDIKDGFERRFSKTKNLASEIEEFSKAAFNVANKKNEYQKPIEKAEKELKFKEADPVEIQNEIKKTIEDGISPMIQIEANKGEADDGLALFKSIASRSKRASFTIRKINQGERGYLTNKIKKNISDILTNAGVKTKAPSVDWANFIFDCIDKNFSALEENMDTIRKSLYSVISSATKIKGDISVSYKDIKINIEVKNTSKINNDNFVELLIIFTHDKKGVIPIVRLAKKLKIEEGPLVALWVKRYNEFIEKLGVKTTLQLNDKAYVMTNGQIYSFSAVNISTTGKDFRYIKVKTALKNPVSIFSFLDGVIDGKI